MMYGHGVVGLLLTAVAGYWVLERASAHKGQLQKVGYFVGSLVIVASLMGLIASVWCFGADKGWMCPFGGKMGRGAYSPYIPGPGSTK